MSNRLRPSRERPVLAAAVLSLATPYCASTPSAKAPSSETPPADPVVWAVNVGGPAYSSTDGIRYEAESAAWDVETAKPGYLVTTDSYYPGWNAYLDGIPTPVYRANLAFRAVRMPARNQENSMMVASSDSVNSRRPSGMR